MNWRNLRRGFSGLAIFGFGLVVVAASLVSLSYIWFGKTAIWWGITTLMVGLCWLLASCRCPLQRADWTQSLGEIVRLRRFWIPVLVSVTINVCWHFLVAWLPLFLINDRKMAYLEGGLFVPRFRSWRRTWATSAGAPCPRSWPAGDERRARPDRRSSRLAP